MDAASLSSPTVPSPRIVICPWLAFGHLLPYLELSRRRARPRRRSWTSWLSRSRASTASPTAPSPQTTFPMRTGSSTGRPSTASPRPSRSSWPPRAPTKPRGLTGSSPTPSITGLAAAARTVPRYEREAMASFFTGHDPSSGMSTIQRCTLTKERCTLTAIRSCVEWEPESFPLAATLLGKPVLPLGLLPPSSDGGRCATGTNGSAEHATVRWLDAQPQGSVVYVALGSEVPLRVEQVRELALGLELAGTRFLWALRKPSGAAVLDADASDMLPPRFRDRTHGQGMVTTGWVPQMSILAHAAVGGFLTHCGRNSLIEGLLFGHPLVMLPIIGDQGPNARQMEAKKVGLQVARDEKDGSFDRHGVAAAVQAVMVEGESRRGFVTGAAKMQKVVAGTELQERYVDEFVQQLRAYTTASATDNGNVTTAAHTSS